MSYYCEDDSIDTLKLQHATFQITLVNKATDTYRFSFNGSSNISNPHANNFLQVGKNIATKFHHNYVDFKLLVPNGYQPANNCGQEYKSTMRNLINKYVYDGSSVINEVNYFILNDKALKIYQNEIYQQLPYANHQYSIADIDCQAQLYFLIINGMLFQSIE